MDDIEKTMPGHRLVAGEDVSMPTMAGKRERKPDGRFDAGDLIMGRYKVLSELGQGGMGVVYKCFDETAGIEIALKALPPELSHNTLEMEDIKDNFQLVSKLVHQNIAISKQLERDPANGNYYLIMECVNGEDLRHWIRRKRKEGALNLQTVLPVIHQVAEALDFAHKQKIIHRDIKPGNIMIDMEGNVKVLDFGLAAQIHTSMTHVSMAYHGTSGTGPYMAPEQWKGQAQGAAADQYALAVMAYEMLAGHLPFECTDAVVLQQAVLTQNAQEISDAPNSVKKALHRAMSKEPSKRFECCMDFFAALSGGNFSSGKRTGGKTAWGYLVIILLSGLVCAGGYGYWRYDKHQTKLAEEKAKQEELARQEAEKRKQLLQDISDLKSLAEQKKNQFETVKPDPGQTFGEHFQNFTDLCGKAEVLISDNPEKAYQFYKDALKHADWIEKNIPLRRKTLALQEQIAVLKNQADHFEASKLSKEQYRQGIEKVQAGKNLFEQGSFEESIEQYEAASIAFIQAGKDAKKQKNETILAACLQAKEDQDWELLANLAEQLQEYDAVQAGDFAKTAESGKEALALKAKRLAEEQAKKEAEQKRLAEEQAKQEAEQKRLAEEQAKQEAEQKRLAEEQTKQEAERLAELKKKDFEIIYLPNNVKLEMIKVKAGTFTMSKKDGDNDSDEIEHVVSLKHDFYIGKYELTQKQWSSVVGKPPFHFQGDDFPMWVVSWKNAVIFCDIMNKKGLAPIGWKFTLPTETQWEYAARGGSKSCEYKYSGSNNLDAVAWYSGNSQGQIHPVGTKQPNELDIYDMSGNVMEWCLDDWCSNSNEAIPEFQRTIDEGGLRRVMRGGSWSNGKSSCRVTYRTKHLAVFSDSFVGFRLALVPEQETSADSTEIKKETVAVINQNEKMNPEYKETQKVGIPVLKDVPGLEGLFSNTVEYTTPLIRASHILIAVPENATAQEKKAAYEKISRISEKLAKNPSEFNALAKKYSDCPSGKQDGGSLGQFSKNQLDPDFYEAARALTPGEISNIVTTKFGYHLIRRDRD